MSLVGELAVAAEENLAHVNGWRAQAAGSDIHGGACLRWTYTPQPLWLPGCDRALLPPTAAPADADALLEEALAFYEQWETAIWCTTSARRTPPEWHGYLKAAGWRYQFSGTCMAADLRALPAAPALPEAVEIGEMRVDWGERKLADAAAGANPEHPYFGALQVDSAANEFAATLRMAECGQARIFHARRSEEWLGSAMLCAAAGVVGIYDVGVGPAARRQGIASALVRHVCEAARAAGCEHATLQNGHGLIAFYERLGFRVVSTLQHWQRAAAERIPTRAERARLRAGPDYLLLEAFLHHFFCGERDAAAALLRERPALARLRQTNGATALHVVSFHGEVALARELLAAGADLEARERDFGATPLIHAVIGAGPWGPQLKTGQVAVIRRLLAAGADPQATNAWGETAAQVAPITLPGDVRAALGAES